MRKLIGGCCLCLLLTQGSVAQVIQLPSYRVFSIQTSGVVPDQGTAVVGGVRGARHRGLLQVVPSFRQPVLRRSRGALRCKSDRRFWIMPQSTPSC